ncbi:mitochondrial import inner membrane translocase subunit Tim21 [Phymastichus coffea]|uniref:mitochondrial import inner membrane translocase subunit Tim21 n=1 Tax=Phymastichus coffea TaxID=108790 RepID=UPI00273BC022|nr:mitochondrial import inner membrane translocase subunit Tim21 [Phymastichus coffea]
MATTKALLYFVRRSSLLPSVVQITPIKSNFYLPLHVRKINYSDQKSVTKSERSDLGGQVQIGFGEAVKENTKSAWYMSVIIAGVGVTAVIFYAIFRELFSKKSPNGVYSTALDRIMQDKKVIDAVGAPIKAYGEETRRGRRGHVSHQLYEKNGVSHMRMKFYIQGIRKQGTVNLEVREDLNGNWVYRYLFVQLKDLANTVIILEDNRNLENNVYKTPNELSEMVSSEFKL